MTGEYLPAPVVTVKPDFTGLVRGGVAPCRNTSGVSNVSNDVSYCSRPAMVAVRMAQLRDACGHRPEGALCVDAQLPSSSSSL